jgi:hypothetical protein
MEEFENEILKIVERGNDKLIIDYEKVENSFLDQILKYVRDRFSYTSNKLDRNNDNKKKIIALKEWLVKNGDFSINELTIKNYLQDINSILDLNHKTIDRLDFKKQTFTLEKDILFNDTIDRILNKDAFLDNLLPDAKQTIYRGITFNETYKSLENNLTKSFENTPSMRYVKQVSRDSINQFDGSIQDKARELYKFNAFSYNGSLIATSRKTCKGLVKGEDVYKQFLIPNYVRKAYFVKDIPKIIELSKNNPGWNPDSTPETFATFSAGYECRHRVSFFMYVK